MIYSNPLFCSFLLQMNLKATICEMNSLLQFVGLVVQPTVVRPVELNQSHHQITRLVSSQSPEISLRPWKVRGGKLRERWQRKEYEGGLIQYESAALFLLAEVLEMSWRQRLDSWDRGFFRSFMDEAFLTRVNWDFF